MKQKIVIKVSMPSQKNRSKAMAMAARADGVISVGIAGDDKDRVGDGVDSVCLVSCLRRKFSHAEILQVEEVKDKKSEEKKAEEKKPEETNAVVHQHPYHHHYCYPGGFYHHHPPPPMAVCDEQSNCTIM